jgi:isopentenyldiphosphate isomerase
MKIISCPAILLIVLGYNWFYLAFQTGGRTVIVDEEEQLEIVNENGEVVGVAPRSVIHGNPASLHRVVHVLVFNREGGLLLQKRSMQKDVAPGKWDTSVGGHVGVSEVLLVSAKRETEEELGITDPELDYLYSYIHRNCIESELVTTYRCTFDGDICALPFNREEIDEIRFWNADEIEKALGKQILSDNFEDEYRRYLETKKPL